MELSIIIPAYNEAAAIHAGKLAQVINWLEVKGKRDFLEDEDFRYEVIVVDDGSEDDTAMLAVKAGARVITIPHAGKAAAIIAGIRAARYDLLITDMDQAVPISQADRLIHLSCFADCPPFWFHQVIIGSRGLKRPGAPVSRYVLAWGQMILRTILLGLPYKDTQCGFKAFDREGALNIIDHLVIYKPDEGKTAIGPNVSAGFDVEMLLVARSLGYTVKEIPVQWQHQPTRRVRFGRDALRGVLALLGIWFAKIDGQYPGKHSLNKLESASIFFFLFMLFNMLMDGLTGRSITSNPITFLLGVGALAYTIAGYRVRHAEQKQ